MALHLPPVAPDIVRSLRGLGYSTATAIADLIDNSITAGASQIDVDFEWRDNAPYVEIVDNGQGMDRGRLIEAMRMGTGSRGDRQAGDMGRFGLGLKTASLSQATVLTVISKERSGKTAAAQWDLEKIEASADWELWEGAPSDLGLKLPKLDSLTSGTAVRWDKLDRLLGKDGDVDNFFAIAESVGQHLAMTFHRLLSAKDLRITLNGASLAPWDPVAEDICAPIGQKAIGATGRIVCSAYIVHSPAGMTGEQARRAAGPLDWIQQQGFYVYRERRLIVGGGWLGLGPANRPWRLDPRYNLSRLTIDITNAEDEYWAIDLRKASAEPPANCREDLSKFAKSARRRAVIVSRGTSGSSPLAANLGVIDDVPIWMPGRSAATAPFRVNRRHPLVSKVRAALTDASLLRSLLDQIEKAAPLQPISASTTTDIAVTAALELKEADIRKVLLTVYPNYRRVLGLSHDDACKKLLTQPHFREHVQLVLATVAALERDMIGVS